MLVPPHFFVSTAFKKMRLKDEFRKWLPKLPIVPFFLSFLFLCFSSALLVGAFFVDSSSDLFLSSRPHLPDGNHVF